MGVDHVERVVGEVEGVDVADDESTLTPCTPASARTSSAAAVASRAVTPPGATAAARSAVIVPGPAPTSSRLMPGRSAGSRYAAEFSAVRQRWERRTDS